MKSLMYKFLANAQKKFPMVEKFTLDKQCLRTVYIILVDLDVPDGVWYGCSPYFLKARCKAIIAWCRRALVGIQPDGRKIFIGAKDGSVKIFDLLVCYYCCCFLMRYW